MHIALCAASAFCSGQGLAGDIEKSIYTTSLSADVGGTFTKSHIVGGADFGLSQSYAVGTYAGKNKTLKFALHFDDTSTKFSFINARVESRWTTALVGYRFGWFMPVAGLTGCQIRGAKDDVEVVNAIGLGAAEGLTAIIPFGDVVLDMEALFASSFATSETAGQQTKIGERQDFNVGVIIATPLDVLSITLGQRTRFSSVNIAGTNDLEVQSGPYVGVRLGLNF